MIKCEGCDKTININHRFCPKCGYYNKKKGEVSLKFIYLSITIISITIYFLNPSLKEKIIDLTTIEIKNYTKDGFGNYYKMSFYINNSSKYNITNPKIRCKFYNNNTLIGKNYKKLETTINKNEYKFFNNITMGYINEETEDIKCKIVDFEMVDN